MSPDELKKFEDPLMDRVKGAAEKKAGGSAPPKTGGGDGGQWLRILGVIALAAILVTGFYLLYSAQQRIEVLSTDLMSSQEALQEVTNRLEVSQNQIVGLEDGLNKSQGELGSQKQQLGRYRELYTNLKTEQSEQTKELEALSIRKANQSDVDNLKGQTEGLEENLSEVNSDLSEVTSRMAGVNSNIADVREMSTRNRADLDATRGDLDNVRSSVEGNTAQISGVKRSLERDYYNFELRRKGGVIKVQDVSFSLKKIDFKRQRFNLEILSGDRRIRKKNQHINEPIYFHVADNQKPYEVLIHRIDKRFVVGYLSVPKS
jgi:chromosome segregation ATPase